MKLNPAEPTPNQVNDFNLRNNLISKIYIGVQNYVALEYFHCYHTQKQSFCQAIAIIAKGRRISPTTFLFS